MSGATRQHHRVVVIGAGPGGMCAAIRLREAGVDDVLLLERADGFGGTWHHNRYPGAACDVTSHLYSFSFAQKADWSRPYAGHEEIRAYMRQVAHDFGLEPITRLGTGVRSARWDEAAARWTVVTDTGDEIDADVLISAVGMFCEINVPDIPGLGDFAGPVVHTARWDESLDLTGRRVGVIGSAASAVQLVPEVAKVAGHLAVFQRSANWVLPKNDELYSEEQLEHFRRHPEEIAAMREAARQRTETAITYDPPVLEAATRIGLQALEIVEDPEVRRRLTPTVPYGCHRPLISNAWYPAFNRPNVELVTDPIERITASGVVTADGVERTFDVLVLATGFRTTRYASTVDLVGRDGLRIEDAWADGAQAYLGITTSGFPNLFMLYGPNTNNGSIIQMIEYQVDYVVRHVLRLADEGLAWIDVRPEVMAAYNERLQHELDAVEVWQTACHGYYRHPVSGRIVTQWPHTMAVYRERTSAPDEDAYASAAR